MKKITKCDNIISKKKGEEFIINLINGDCLKILPELKEKSINLVIADLPYGKTKNKWDKIIPFEKMWEEVERVTKDNAAIIFFSQGIFLC